MYIAYWIFPQGKTKPTCLQRDCWIYSSDGGEKIAYVASPKFQLNKPYRNTVYRKHERYRNACLIAASPAMYEALNLVFASNLEPEIKRLVAEVLTKAEGNL
jgi:hypothetical protein